METLLLWCDCSFCPQISHTDLWSRNKVLHLTVQRQLNKCILVHLVNSTLFFLWWSDHRASLARLAPASCECWRRARRKSIRPSNSIYLCWFPEQSDGFISSKRAVTGINSNKPEVWEKGNCKQNCIIKTSYLTLLTSTNLSGETVVSLRQYLNWIGRWTYKGHEPMPRSVHPSDVLDILWAWFLRSSDPGAANTNGYLKWYGDSSGGEDLNWFRWLYSIIVKGLNAI